MQSFTKPVGDILLERCSHADLTNGHRTLFPLDQDPYKWKSCHDAYEYTWNTDKAQQIAGLNSVNKIKLINSMGYCPHMRCQLTNVSSADFEGNCPTGLCYTKIENGALSFGACCFKNGEFDHGELIGYYNKTQTTPKPIYKRSRVVLGANIGDQDSSYHSFINANMIYPNVIATQCPMQNTIVDIERMIREQNISLWIQLAPNEKNNSHRQDDCHYLPNALKTQELLSNEYGIENIETISALSESISDGGDKLNTVNIKLEKTKVHLLNGQPFTHVWYRSWKDFDVPPLEDMNLLRDISGEAVAVLKKGGKVAISCLSGRGRTGTLSAVIAGKYQLARSHNELVDIIVKMRESRDGVVETPAQYRFAARMLDLSDPSYLGNNVRQEFVAQYQQTLYGSNGVQTPAFDYQHTVFITLTLVLSIFLAINPILFMVRKMYI